MTPENQLQRQIETARQYIEMNYHVVLEEVLMDTEPKQAKEQFSSHERQALLVALSSIFTPKIPRNGVYQKVDYIALRNSLRSGAITIFTDDGMRSVEIRKFLTALRTIHEELNFRGDRNIPTSVLLTPDKDVTFSREEIGRIICICRE